MKHPKPNRGHFPSRSLALAALLGLLGAGVQAQDLDPQSLQELDDDRDDVLYQNVSLSRLEDMQVSRDGQVIGEVEEILGDASGQPVAVVVEFEDELERELMGRDDHEVIIALDELDMDAQAMRLELSLENEELAALPRWED